MSAERLFPEPPEVEFRPRAARCPGCGKALKVCKSRTRSVRTLHAGPFRAREVFLRCATCGRTERSGELRALVPPGANFGYDVMVHAGKALFLRHRNEAEVVAELARMNVRVSPREVSSLGAKFIVHLALAHRRRAPEMRGDMLARGGYVCHLDATCEGGGPMLMSSIDSLSSTVLGNVKLPAEDEAHIVPFLERIKQAFGVPLALVHDMGAGILKAVAVVFPGVADFVCHFHFLRDIGKDFLGAGYDTVRKRLRHHGVAAALHHRAKQLKREMDATPAMAGAFRRDVADGALPAGDFASTPVAGAYALIQWALAAKAEGDGYGFPFDQPHLAFARRLRVLDEAVEGLKRVELRGLWRDNVPYFKIHNILKPAMKDRVLWKAVDDLGARTAVFAKLRGAMRIALPAGPRGLNDEGCGGSIRTIERRVVAFRAWLARHKDFAGDRAAAKMVGQIDAYWGKLFADPVAVRTPAGPVMIQPQRTNNILEQFFRGIKRAHRRRTGNASAGRMLRAILAETPLVRNLENPRYMELLLGAEPSLEAVFAKIEAEDFREAFRDARDDPERIPAALKPVIAMPDLPAKLLKMVEDAAA